MGENMCKLTSSPVRELSPDKCNFVTKVVPSNKDPNHSDTLQDDLDKALDKGAAGKIWQKCMKAEQQTVLLRTLVNRKVGTRDLEEHFKGQARTRRMKKNQKRDENLILKSMSKKCIDASDVEKNARKEKAKFRRKMEQKVGKNSSKMRNLVKKMKKETTEMKKQIQLKNKQKVNHLVKQYKNKEEEVPKDLLKYKTATVFSEKEIEPTEEGNPIVIDAEVDDDELAVLALPPKFAVYQLLSEEQFEVDMEISLTEFVISDHQYFEIKMSEAT